MERTSRLWRTWAIAAALFAVVNAVPLASASSSPIGTVAISNVNVASNSLSGHTADVTWSTNPTSACDVFAYQVQGASTWTTLTLPCKVHSASLNGLTTHTTYAYSIASSAKRYNSATYTGSFYPTDVSTSKAYETFQYSLPLSVSNCPVTYKETLVVEMPGDIEFDPAQATNPNHYESFGVHMHYIGLGQPVCQYLSQIVTAQQTFMNVWVLDTTSHTTNWFAGGIPDPNVAGSGTTGSITWSINFGAQVYGAGFGVTMGFNPPTGVTVYPSLVNAPYPDGWQMIGRFEIDWQTGYLQTIDDVVWPIHITDSLAQAHLHDQVLVRVFFATTISVWDPNVNQWVSTVTQWGVPGVILGQGSDNNGQNNLDQFTDIQAGTCASPGQ